MTSLCLPAIALLISFPGFFKPFRSKAPPDTVQTPWRSASRLGIENQFVFRGMTLQVAGSGVGTPARLKVPADPRQLYVHVYPESGYVSTVPRLGEVPLQDPARGDMGAFARASVAETFRKQWADRSRSQINSLGAFTPMAAQERTGLSFQLPSPLPRQVQSLLGPGGPALNVSGSENIVISGTSNWTNLEVGTYGQKKSLFPTLDMQQNLDIRLEGQLSDRVKINLLQNSANQIPLANKIAINYRADPERGEDDLIQSLDLGNTNLTLPGTQYVSYSGRNEGLFGMKATSRLGPLDLTVLASKQEGRSERASYQGGASRRRERLHVQDYIKGTYYMLYDPNLEPSWSIPDTSIRLYRDDGAFVNEVTIPGRARLDPTGVTPEDTAFVNGNFKLLNQGEHYEILSNIYGPLYKIIRVRQPLADEQVLAVTYTRFQVDALGNPIGPGQAVGGNQIPDSVGTRRLLKLLRPPFKEQVRDGNGFYRDSVGVTISRHLELKNLYQLPGQKIDRATFQLTIELGDEVPPVTFVIGSGNVSIPYLEMVGLDNLDESTDTPSPGHDGKIDGSISRTGTRPFVDYDEGILFFPELRPFDPQDGPFDQEIKRLLTGRRELLDGSLGEADETNPVIYDRYNPERRESKYRIAVDFTAQRAAGEIQLGRGSIVEGSDVVTVNGMALVRDRDYTIDYDLGRVVLKRQLGPSDNLNIDYSYAPLFQQAGRTLLGSAFRVEGRDRSLGGAFMYESRGAQDRRPRLGEEPSRSVIGDLNGEWKMRPMFLTRLADKLPGIRTTSPSELNIQAEMGMSFPNPNTRNEIYIDDMEGVRDAVSLSMAFERWRWSSVPSRRDGASIVSMNDVPGNANAEVKWYSPYAEVKEGDLRPQLRLTDPTAAQNNRTALAISVPRRPKAAALSDSLWVGLTYPLDKNGIDLTRSQFIELWVNDWNDRHEDPAIQVPRVRGRNVKMHIDIGEVSEDMQRAPDAAPNRGLDTEDQYPADNQLVVTDSKNEDTGYDGRLDPAERDTVTTPLDLTTANPADPEGDNFAPINEDFDGIDPRRFLGANGVQDNKNIYPYPDTEDLNLNGIFDTRENYFEYTIDLGDTTYLESDLQRDYPELVAPDNGWRRYRIPLADERRTVFGIPDLARVLHVRVWFEGILDGDSTAAEIRKPLLMLGNLEIVGSRWRTLEVPNAIQALGTQVTLNSVNNIENDEIYSAPFEVGEVKSGNRGVPQREQSLALEFVRFFTGDTIEAFKTFSLEEDYSRYGKLSWYAAGFDLPDYTAGVDTSLYYFVRFSSDEAGRSYYEYLSRLPRSSRPDTINWDAVQIPLTDLSNLKIDAPPAIGLDTLVAPGRTPGVTYKIVGRPSFTRLRRISFGLINETGREMTRGQLWFNELRSTDVARDRGEAYRVQAGGRLANLASYNFSFNSRDADFLSVGDVRGTGNTINSYAVGGTVDLHRFFEATGIVLPLTIGHSGSLVRPRFTIGDDVIRTGADASASESRGSATNWSLSYRRQWSERANPFLRYTIGGIDAGISGNTSYSRTPSSVDTTTGRSANVNYSIGPRRLLSLPLLGRARLFPLPERIFANYAVSTRESRAYDRLRDSAGTLVPRSLVKGRTETLLIGTDLRPIDSFAYRVDALRNLVMPPGMAPEELGSMNLGRTASWKQSTSINTGINRGTFLRPTLTFGTNYGQDNHGELAYAVRSMANGQSYALRWDLPFESLDQRVGVPVRAPNDTLPKPFKIPRARWWLSRLGNISADFAFNRSSSYSRVTGSTDWLYFFGFEDNPGTGGDRNLVAVDFANQTLISRDWRMGGRTRFLLGYGASANFNAEYTRRNTEQNGVPRRNDSQRFPDVTLEYGRWINIMQLNRIFTSPRLRTAYSRSQSSDYNNSSSPTSISTNSDWRPFLGLNGEFKNGTRMDLNVNRRVTQNEQFQLGQQVTTERNTSLDFSVNRSYTQGQKVNILGKQSTVKTSINLGFTLNYDMRSRETVVPGDPINAVRYPVKEDRLSANATGSYGFSSNVTGNITLGFGQNRDLLQNTIRRNLRVEARGSFNF